MIHVIGDSHVMLFTGQKLPYLLVPSEDCSPAPYDLIEGFRTYFCVLLRAFHIVPNTTSPQAAHFFRIVDTLPKGSTILISAGEIDCRGPIINLYRNGNILLNETKKCAERYLTGVKLLKDKGYNPIIFAPYPHLYTDRKETGEFMGLPKDLPVEKWCLLKELVVYHFDLALKQSEFPIVSLNEWIFMEGISKRQEYYADLIHLSERAWPHVVEELSKCLPASISQLHSSLL